MNVTMLETGGSCEMFDLLNYGEAVQRDEVIKDNELNEVY